MKEFFYGMMIGAACVFMWFNHNVGNYPEILAGLECIEQLYTDHTTEVTP